MAQLVRAVYQDGAFVPEEPCDVPDGMGVELIVQGRAARPSFFKMGELIMDTFKMVERLYERKELLTGVPTGFLSLDRMTAGLQPSDLIIVAARPSMGKTSFVLSIAQYIALAANTAVGIFSLEMSKEQLVLQMLCSQARVADFKVCPGSLGERDSLRLAMAAERLAEAPIFIDDTPPHHVRDLCTKVRRLHAETRIGLVIIDNLLMQLFDAQGNRIQGLSAIARSLKSLARELKVPIIATSPLSHRVERRADKRPKLSDIDGLDELAPYTDVIMFIYRDKVYNPYPQDEGEAEIIIGKQRNGPTGTVYLAFREEYARFDNLVERLESLEETAKEG